MEENKKRFHIGVIPDGNRSWARENNLSDRAGHERGAVFLPDAVDWALHKPEIAELSIYLFSEENFKRSDEELEWLNNIYTEGLDNLFKLELVHETQTRVKMVTTNLKGLQSGMFKETLDSFKVIENKTRNYKNKTLNLLIAYTGKNEIAQATGTLRNRFKNLFFNLTEKDITAGMKIQNKCDFIIRSGLEEAERESKSGFLIWQAAYSENYHINKNWGDVTLKDLDLAWDYFKGTRRAGGK